MRIHILMHVSFEGPGYIEDWARLRNHTLSITRFYKNELLPEMELFDAVIVMGGPMNVYDEKFYPWLKKEKDFLKKALNHVKKIIGICLGAQLMAVVLGASVTPNPEKEIGWFPIYKTEDAFKIPLLKDFRNDMIVFHWHGDTFSIPDNAIPLFESAGCKNQAFLYRNQVLALQFHLEITKISINALLEHNRSELTIKKYIQHEARIRTGLLLYEKENNLILKRILDEFLAHSL